MKEFGFISYDGAIMGVLIQDTYSMQTKHNGSGTTIIIYSMAAINLYLHCHTYGTTLPAMFKYTKEVQWLQCCMAARLAPSHFPPCIVFSLLTNDKNHQTNSFLFLFIHHLPFSPHSFIRN